MDAKDGVATAVAPYLRGMPDRNTDVDIKTIVAEMADPQEASRMWREVGPDLPAYSQQSYWYHFAVRSSGSNVFDGFLYYDYPRQDILNVYVIDDAGRGSYYETGSLRPFNTRPIAHENFVFPLRLDPGRTYKVFIQVRSRPQKLVDHLSVVSRVDFYRDYDKAPVRWGLTAVLAFAVVLMVTMAVWWRQLDYVLLALFTSLNMLLNMISYGWAFRYFWPDYPVFNDRIIYILLAATGAMLLIFNAKVMSDVIAQRLFSLGSWVGGGLLMVVALLTDVWGNSGWYRAVAILLTLVIFLAWQVFFIGRMAILGSRYARYVFISWLCIAFSWVLLPGVLSMDFWSRRFVSGYELALVFEMVLLLMMLLHRDYYRYGLAQTRDISGRVRDHLLGRMSHEIRTPLNGILGVVELLGDTRLGRAQKHYVELISISSKALLNVINDILDYSRMQIGQLSLEHQAFDLRMFFRETMSMFHLRAEQKDVELCCRIDPALPAKVVGDQSRLRQLLINLIDNALKFTEQGVVEVVAAPTGQVGMISLSVRDYGPGVSDALRERLLSKGKPVEFSDQFQRGRGLGVSICRQLAEMMAGKLEIETAPVRGSIFRATIRLPGAEGMGPAADFNAALSGCHLLMVSHRQHYCRCVREFFRTRSLPVTVVDGMAAAQEVLEAMASDVQPVVLMDCSHFDAKALELIATWRESAGIRKRPTLVLLTSTLTAEDAIQRYGSDVDLVVERPLIVNELEDIALLACQRVVRGRVLQTNGEAAHSLNDELNILVAEDNEVNQMVVEGMLRRLRHRSTVVENGALALEIYRHCHGTDARWQQFDLILMDCDMPAMDGFEATQRIRRFELENGRPRTPVIALTAHNSDEIVGRCTEAGVDELLIKPIGFEQLKRLLDKYTVQNIG